jgi:hypothetical protein
VGKERHHEKPLVPESDDHGLIPVPKMLGPFREEDFLTDREGEQTEDRKIYPGDDEEENAIFQGPVGI